MAGSSPTGYYTQIRCEVASGIEDAWRVSVFGTSRHHGTREPLAVNAAPSVDSGQRWCEGYVAKLLGARSLELVWESTSSDREGEVLWVAALNLDVT